MMSSILGAPNLQIFDNATFDEKPQWHHDPIKENRSVPSNLHKKPQWQHDPIKENRNLPSNFPDTNRPFGIDAEILDVETQISQLSKKLETLKIKKVRIEFSNKSTPLSTTKNRGRIIPAKFLNLETPPRTTPTTRWGLSLGLSDIYQNATPFRARKPLEGIIEGEVRGKDLETSQRRRMSIGPSAIYQNATPFRCQRPLKGVKEEKGKDWGMARRRGMSLGPSEILKQARMGQEGKEKGSSSMSPKSRKPMNLKVLELRNGVSTVGAKKLVKMNKGSISRVKPKTLFEESMKSLSSNPKPQTRMNLKVSELRNGVSTIASKKMVKMDDGLISGVLPQTLLFEEKKRPLKNAKVRIVASRYSLASSTNNVTGNKRRKWSFPEEREKDETKKGVRRKRCFSLGGANVSQLKEERSPPSSIMKIAKALPKITTLRCAIESPRDSGCVMRVADLVGKKPCFNEFSLSSSCQSLKFEDGED